MGFCAVSQQEIVSLYERFCQLDRNAKGFISTDEFLSVPEFAMNPLSQVFLSDSSLRKKILGFCLLGFRSQALEFCCKPIAEAP